MNKKRVILSVTNDLVTDNRLHKTACTLLEMGFDVLLVGRHLSKSADISNRPYATKRFKLLFSKGFAFYANYNIRLCWFLLFTKGHVLLANDLDTLPANFLVSRIKGIPLVYDSHEYFTEVPELQNRAFVRNCWKKMEAFILPRLTHAYTVSSSIAKAYETMYKTRFQVIRNLPVYTSEAQCLQDFERPVIIYQGAVNMGRNIDKLVLAMKELQQVTLWIVGTGDLFHEIEKLVQDQQLQEKVKIFGKIPLEKLPEITRKATLGVSLEEPFGLNYTYALPNKLFDYLHAGLPVLVSKLPEMEAVVSTYQVGETIEECTPQYIAETIRNMLNNTVKMEFYRKNAMHAAKELCWQNEAEKLKSIFAPFA